jgi:TolA-binding protein
VRRCRTERRGRSGGVLALIFGLLASGCADVGGTLDQDVAQLRQDVNALKLSAHRSRGDAEAIAQLRQDVNALKSSATGSRAGSDALAQLERRTRDQAADNARHIAEVSGRLDSMSTELNRVSAKLDELSRRLEAAARRPAPNGGPGLPSAAPPVIGPVSPVPPPTATGPSKAMPPIGAGTPAPSPVTPLSKPSPPIATAPAVPPSVSSAPAPAPLSAPPTPARPSSGSATAEESYQAAYLDFSRGRYPLAISGFREFLRRYPDSPLADSAQYGIGESYYSLAAAAGAEGQSDKARGNLEQAVQEFRKVIVTYPRGAKVPTALYKEALALAELKQTALAQTRLQYLLDHFPQSEEAPLAKERLAALRR